MRKYIQLFESITNDAGLNQRIDDTLDDLPKTTDQGKVLDGLEQIMNVGAEGISSRDWIASMQKIHTDLSAENLRDIMVIIIKSFKFCVQKNAEGKYVWNVMDDEETAPSEQEHIDPSLHAMASQQIAITHRIIELMREKRSFTMNDILPHIVNMGLPHDMARMMFDHVLQGMMGKSVRKQGDTYHYHEEQPKSVSDHMRSFRDMLDTPQEK